MLKLVGEDLRKSRIFAWSLSVSPKIYNNKRVRTGKFSVERPGGHALGQVLKVSISNKTN